MVRVTRIASEFSQVPKTRLTATNFQKQGIPEHFWEMAEAGI